MTLFFSFNSNAKSKQKIRLGYLDSALSISNKKFKVTSINYVIV